MIGLGIVLQKTKEVLVNFEEKASSLNTYWQRVGGKIMMLSFDKRITTFELTDFEKRSKKLRSNTIEVQIKDIFQYELLAICISTKRDQYLVNTAFLLRNVVDRTPYEFNIPLFSPIVEDLAVLFQHDKLKHLTKSKYYSLRDKPMPESTVNFYYIADMLDPDIVEKEMENSVFKNMLLSILDNYSKKNENNESI